MPILEKMPLSPMLPIEIDTYPVRSLLISELLDGADLRFLVLKQNRIGFDFDKHLR